MDGWMGGWMDGWMDVKAVLRIAYSNQKEHRNEKMDIYFDGQEFYFRID